MKIGLVGLGKMGFNLALNLKSKGHTVLSYDINAEALQAIAQEGILATGSLSELVKQLNGTRVIWLMLPSGLITESTLQQLKSLLTADDIIIDGGNSNYKDSVRRSAELSEQGIYLLDCGTSGGTEGALHGICAMIGGAKKAFDYCEPVFKDISIPNGYLYCGESGSGHYVKMIHNGIEYGMMQSIAEGFEMLEKSEFNLNLPKVAHLWNHGSVVRSWLMELTENALRKEPDLGSIKGVVNSSGEGKWTLETALEKQIPTPVIALSVIMRYRSLQENTFSGKLLSALRNEFGGHAVVKQEV